jgi:hypothetical protein
MTGRSVPIESTNADASRRALRQKHGGARRAFGRPPKLRLGNEIAVEEAIERLGELQCTLGEVASFLGISRMTLFNRFRDEPELRERYERGRDGGRISLRHLLRWHAERPNASGVNAAIFLARAGDWLDMREQPAASPPRIDAVEKKSPAEILRNLTDDELQQLRQIRMKIERPVAS